MIEITVITCTHNPRPHYLELTVKGLASQSLQPTLWEYLLIDNASAPASAPNADLSWHPNARLLQEGLLGLTPARLRGIREARGELLVFVDDDNVLDPDFLETALKMAKTLPFLGSWSGQCRACFESPPPEWTRPYWGNLVIREFNADRWSNLPRLPDTMPCGAGLCVRRHVALHYAALHQSGQRQFQFDRTGDSLLSGGDNDLAGCACDLGMGVGLVSSLKLTHLIPPERLTLEYLAKLSEGISFSSALLDSTRGIETSPRGIAGKIADCLRVFLLPPPCRTIARAACRGRERAVQMLGVGQHHQLPNNNSACR